MHGIRQAPLRIGMAMVAALFWTTAANLVPIIGGRDPIEAVLRGGSVQEIAITLVVSLAAVIGYALAARSAAGLMQRAGVWPTRSRAPHDRQTADPGHSRPAGPCGIPPMSRWIAKAVVSALYWLLAGHLLIGLFMADPAAPASDTGPWPARLLLALAVLGWAALSWIWDRTVAT